MPNAYAMAMVDFQSFLSFILAYFSPIYGSLAFLLFNSFKQVFTGETQDSNKEQIGSEVFKQSTLLGTPVQQETPDLHIQYIYILYIASELCVWGREKDVL